MMTIAETLRTAAAQLEDRSDTPRFDAELLMAHALNVSRSDLLLGHMRDDTPDAFAALVARRVAHEPVAYITGHQEFYGLDFIVTPDVLIPRPDSETLIDTAISLFADAPPQRIIDLGTGSGALLLTALTQWPDARGLGVDQSASALDVANRNAAALGLDTRADFRQSDWRADGWTDALDGPFDLILCNPPYVETHAELQPNVRDYEPHAALFAGDEGLDDYRILIPALTKLRNGKAPIIFEIGAAQGDAVRDIAAEHGYETTLHTDLAGKPRALALV